MTAPRAAGPAPRAPDESLPVAGAGGAAGDAGLVRSMGLLALTAGIVNVTIGGGIFRLPAGAYSVLGPAAPIAYVVCAVAMGLIVLCFAEAGSRVPLTGGLYAYVEVAFGPLAGFVCGFLLWTGITVALAAVSSFLADAIGALVPALAAPLPRASMLVVVLGTLGAVNVMGVRGASRLNTVMTAAKLVPIALLVLLGASAVRSSNLAIAAMPGIGELSRAGVFLIFAFLGVESALVPSGEVRDPRRTVPRAVLLSMVTITVVYIAVHLVTQGILGARVAEEKTPLAAAAGVALGDWARTGILVGSVLSMFAYVSGMTLAVPRMLFAFGRDGFLPRALAGVHERFHTPVLAIVVQAVLTLALAVGGGFERLAVVANGTVLVAYAACCAAAWQLRRNRVQLAGPTNGVPLGGVAPPLALVVIAGLLWSLHREEWLAVLALLLLALVIYLSTAGHRRRMAA